MPPPPRPPTNVGARAIENAMSLSMTTALANRPRNASHLHPPAFGNYLPVYHDRAPFTPEVQCYWQWEVTQRHFLRQGLWVESNVHAVRHWGAGLEIAEHWRRRQEWEYMKTCGLGEYLEGPNAEGGGQGGA